uniref:WLM domain-containing protein n=1 Tax=viral metagenome TaxID=1070528 RepID=A0A6C0F659_9ZZZZ|tara:strand:+ start:7167 stop:7760 length:594 start_codon:yes stop_codon:yes gene_type:complete
MKQLTLLMICLIAMFLWTNFVRKSLYLTPIKSSIDGKSYMVRPLPDKNKAADRLATLNQSLRRLCDHCVKVSEGKDKETSDNANRLSQNYRGERIIEHIPGNKYVAHSVDKGRELSICIRDKETNQFIDTNTIHFVAIHELAHLMTVAVGHPPEFWKNMKYLLEQAETLGMYTRVDYSESPVDFCGMEINSSPLFPK